MYNKIISGFLFIILVNLFPTEGLTSPSWCGMKEDLAQYIEKAKESKSKPRSYAWSPSSEEIDNRLELIRAHENSIEPVLSSNFHQKNGNCKKLLRFLKPKADWDCNGRDVMKSLSIQNCKSLNTM